MYTASGADPSGYAPTVLGHEGAGVVERVGEGVTLVRPGDHVVTLFSPQCGECVHCRSPRPTSAWRSASSRTCGYLPDGTTRLSRDGEPIRHFMGTLDLRRVHGDARDRAGQDRPGGAARAACLFACGLSTGLGAAMRHGRRSSRGSTCVVFGAGMVGLGAVAGLPAAGGRADRLRRPVARAPRARARPGRDRHARRRPRHASRGSSR